MRSKFETSVLEAQGTRESNANLIAGEEVQVPGTLNEKARFVDSTHKKSEVAPGKPDETNPTGKKRTWKD